MDYRVNELGDWVPTIEPDLSGDVAVIIDGELQGYFKDQRSASIWALWLLWLWDGRRAEILSRATAHTHAPRG